MTGQRCRCLLAVVVVLAVFVLTSCSVERTLSVPTCPDDGGSAIIAAQSVPTASLVPCLDPLPSGWEVAIVSVTQDGTSVVIDSDRAGERAARLHFGPACDVSDAVSTPSDHDDAERFERIIEVAPRFVAERYYRFPGGCVWWEFSFAPGVPSALSLQLGNRLQLLSRQEVNDVLREDFIDRDL